MTIELTKTANKMMLNKDNIKKATEAWTAEMHGAKSFSRDGLFACFLAGGKMPGEFGPNELEEKVAIMDKAKEMANIAKEKEMISKQDFPHTNDFWISSRVVGDMLADNIPSENMQIINQPGMTASSIEQMKKLQILPFLAYVASPHDQVVNSQGQLIEGKKQQVPIIGKNSSRQVPEASEQKTASNLPSKNNEAVSGEAMNKNTGEMADAVAQNKYLRQQEKAFSPPRYLSRLTNIKPRKKGSSLIAKIGWGTTAGVLGTGTILGIIS